MDAMRRCPKCGTGLSGEALQGLCPNCLRQVVFSLPPAATGVAAVAERHGDHIGRYRLLQQLGEGGCGVVYLADQEEPVRRRVALKVIKLGMSTKEVISRFEAERQALALMDHPNIATVLDGGATEAGWPYFVLELVRGVRLTDYCDQHHLDTGERLKLFLQVCHAIQHAHQKGIIHRDIKPSNILVSLQDGVAVPKVIDFGIAKAIGERLSDQTVFTQYQQYLGTPAYMSPEQAGANGLDIDTRSDIYALGVLLFELLTGQTPFDPQTDRKNQRGGNAPLRPRARTAQALDAPDRVGRCRGEKAPISIQRRSSHVRHGADLRTPAVARKAGLDPPIEW
jgi:serine/threonine protein kinase